MAKVAHAKYPLSTRKLSDHAVFVSRVRLAIQFRLVGEKEMSEREIEPLDRLFDLVTELLEEDQDPRAILDSARDAIREWRQFTQGGTPPST